MENLNSHLLGRLALLGPLPQNFLPLPLLLNLGPGVPQSHGAVEDRGPGSGVFIHAEIAHSLELEEVPGPGCGQGRLQAAIS